MKKIHTYIVVSIMILQHSHILTKFKKSDKKITIFNKTDLSLKISTTFDKTMRRAGVKGLKEQHQKQWEEGKHFKAQKFTNINPLKKNQQADILTLHAMLYPNVIYRSEYHFKTTITPHHKSKKRFYETPVTLEYYYYIPQGLLSEQGRFWGSSQPAEIKTNWTVNGKKINITRTPDLKRRKSTHLIFTVSYE